MVSKEVELEQLDELVMTAVEEVALKLTYQVGRELESIDIILNWFPKQSIRTNRIENSDPVTKAALVASLAQQKGDEVYYLQQAGIALYFANKVENLRGSAANFFTNVMIRRRVDLGYNQELSSIVDEITLKELPELYGKGKLDLLLKKEFKEYEGCVEFYQGRGPVIFVHDGKLRDIKKKLDERISQILPQRLEKRGFVRVEVYINSILSELEENG